MFEKNKLTGEIPTEIGALLELQVLDMSYNSLRGPIPDEIGSLKKLRWFRLKENDLSGTLPSSLGLMHSLWSLQTAGNPRLTGEFPPGIWDIESMVMIEIQGCNFTGSIGDGVGKMQRLDVLLLSGNPFSGTVPPSIANVAQLFSLWIDGTNIQGPMPAEVCARRESYMNLDISRPYWQELRADCFGDSPEFECSCCSECCKANGSDCEIVESR